MSKIYHQSLDESKGFSSSSKIFDFRDMTNGHKSNVLAQDGIFSSISEIKRFPMIIKNVSIFEMLKNHHDIRAY